MMGVKRPAGPDHLNWHGYKTEDLLFLNISFKIILLFKLYVKWAPGARFGSKSEV